jgi:hypothetical protein
MSRMSLPTLDHQWDPHQVLDIQRDRRCVGWAHSKGRKCSHTVNRADMDACYELLAEMSSKPLDANELQPCLWQLASYGLCNQVHRNVQNNAMVDTWTRMIRTAVWRAETRVVPPYSRIDTRSTTASFANTATVHIPAIQSPSSLSPIVSADPSPTARADLDSTLRCLETLILRLADLRVPGAPHLDAVSLGTHSPAASVSSLHLSDTSSVAASRTTRSQSSTTSHGSALENFVSPQSGLNSSSLDSSPLQNHRRQPHTFTDSSSEARSTISRTPTGSSLPPTSSALPDVTPVASGLDRTSHATNPQQRPADSTSLSTASTSRGHSPSPPSRPNCTTVHVRRLPVSDDCPICYDSMQGQIALDWCKGGCGQSVHKECMDVWRTNCVANGTEISCTMCRAKWTEGCGC